MTRERPGLAGSPRAGGGGGNRSPRNARAPSPARAAGASRRSAAPAAAPGTRRPRVPSPRLVQCPGHGVFPQRRPRHSSGSPPLPLATCGLSEPGKERAPQSPRKPAAQTALATPSPVTDEPRPGTCPVQDPDRNSSWPLGPSPAGGRTGGVPGELSLPEGGLGVPDRVGASDGPLGRIGRGAPQGFPAICCRSLPASLRSWEPWAKPAPGSPGNWSFLSFSLPRLTCSAEVKNWADSPPWP